MMRIIILGWVLALLTLFELVDNVPVNFVTKTRIVDADANGFIDTEGNVYLIKHGSVYTISLHCKDALDSKNCDCSSIESLCRMTSTDRVTIPKTSFLIRKSINNTIENINKFYIAGNGFVIKLYANPMSEKGYACPMGCDISDTGSLYTYEFNSYEMGTSSEQKELIFFRVPTQLFCLEPLNDDHPETFALFGIVPNSICVGHGDVLTSCYTGIVMREGHNRNIKKEKLKVMQSGVGTSTVETDGNYFYPNVNKAGIYEKAFPIFPSTRDPKNTENCFTAENIEDFLPEMITYNYFENRQKSLLFTDSINVSYLPTSGMLWLSSESGTTGATSSYYYLLPPSYDTYFMASKNHGNFFLVAKYDATVKEPTISLRQARYKPISTLKEAEAQFTLGFDGECTFFSKDIQNEYFHFLTSQEGSYLQSSINEISFKLVRCKKELLGDAKQCYGFIIQHYTSGLCNNSEENSCMGVLIGRVEWRVSHEDRDCNPKDLSIYWVSVHVPTFRSVESFMLKIDPPEKSEESTQGYIFTSKQNIFGFSKSENMFKSVFLSLNGLESVLPTMQSMFFSDSRPLSNNKTGADSYIGNGLETCSSANFWYNAFNKAYSRLQYSTEMVGDDAIFDPIISCNFKFQNCTLSVTYISITNIELPLSIIVKNSKKTLKLNRGSDFTETVIGTRRSVELQLDKISSVLTVEPLEAHLYFNQTVSCIQEVTYMVKANGETPVKVIMAPVVFIPFNIPTKSLWYKENYDIAKATADLNIRTSLLTNYILYVVIGSLVIILLTFIMVISMDMVKQSKKTVKGIGRRVKDNIKKGNTIEAKIGLSPIELEKIANNGVSASSYLKKKEKTSEITTGSVKPVAGHPHRLNTMDIFNDEKKNNGISDMFGYY